MQQPATVQNEEVNPRGLEDGKPCPNVRMAIIEAVIPPQPLPGGPAEDNRGCLAAHVAGVSVQRVVAFEPREETAQL